MIMITVVFAILLVWFSVSLLDLQSKISKLLNAKDKANGLTEVERRVAATANECLSQNPQLEKIISDIINCEKSSSERMQTRAKILRAKLKIAIQNPVVRRALYEEIKKRKKSQ